MGENAPEPKGIRYDDDIDEDNDNQSIDSKYNDDEDEDMEDNEDIDDSVLDPLIDDAYM